MTPSEIAKKIRIAYPGASGYALEAADAIDMLEGENAALKAEIARLTAQPDLAAARAEIEAVEAIKFALDEDDPGNCREFLWAWLHGDWRTEWPEFQDILDRHAGQPSAQEVGDD